MKLRIDKKRLAELPEPERSEAEEAIEAIRWARENNPLAFYKPHVKQRALHSFTTQTKCFYGGNQAQPVDEPVLTPGGWRPIGSLQEGELLIAGDGSVVPIIGVYPQGDREIFRLTFDDGAYTHCTEDHLWRVKDRTARHRKHCSRYGEWIVLSLGEMRERWGDVPHPRNRVMIPTCVPELFPRLLPLDPYLLGVLLGDGGLRGDSVIVSTADEEILTAVSAACPEGIRPRYRGQYDYALSGGNRGGRSNPVMDGLRELRLMGRTSHSKFIPAEYLNADPASRLAVLQGLLDTDGSVSVQGHIEYGTVSPMLAYGVAQLVRMLGGKAKVVRRKIGYRVHVRLPHLPAFRLKRKHERCFVPTSTPDERLLWRIEPTGVKEAVCIKVAHPEGTYVTRDGIVTHNSGKTWSGLADDIIQAIDRDAVPKHLLRYKKFEPPFLCRIMAESFPVLENALLQKLQELVPREQLMGGQWGPSKGNPGAYDKNMRVLHFANESKFFFSTYEQEVRKLGAATLDRVHFDEEPPLKHFNECRLRVMVRGGDLLFTMTPLFGLSWTFDQQWQKRGEEVVEDVYLAEDLSIVTADMEDNPTLGAKDIELALAGMSDEEKVARKEGKHVALHGLIYGDFKASGPNSHIVPERPVPENVNVVVAIDPGMRHPAAVVWGYLTPDDTMVVFEAQRFQGMTAAQVSKRILEINEAREVHPLYYIIDPAARNKDHQTGRSVQMEYADNGIVTIPGQHAVTAGINRVRERFQKRTLFIQANCTELIDELQKYRWKAPPRSGEATREAPVKLEDDLCFVAGTEVSTARGQIPIECLREDDLILTREGYFPVRHTCSTRTTEVRRLVYEGGELIGTPDHPIWVNNQFCRLDTLGYGDSLTVWKPLSQSSTRESLGDGIPTQSNGRIVSTITQLATGIFTGVFGKTTMVQSLRAAISIMSMRTRLIMSQPIWPVSHQKSILARIGLLSGRRRQPSGWRKFAPLRRSGMLRQRDERGIARMAKEPGQDERRFYENATNAAESTSGSPFVRTTASAPTNARAHGDELQGLTMRNEAALTVERVSKSTAIARPNLAHASVLSNTAAGTKQVYALEVDGPSEYFANGVLVSNCDSLRYLIMSRPYLPDAATEDTRDPMLRMMQEDQAQAAGEGKDSVNIGQFSGIAS